MTVKIGVLIFMTVSIIPAVEMASPGTFFWRPRVTINIGKANKSRNYMDEKKIAAGYELLVEEYHTSMSILAIGLAYSNAKLFKHQNPFSPYFYTNAYRWTLRSLIGFTEWLGKGPKYRENFANTQKVWLNRYNFLDNLVPHWIRSVLFHTYMNKEDWEKEEIELKKFNKYVLPVYVRHYNYPKKEFINFTSQLEGSSELKMSYSDYSFHDKIN